MRLFFAVCFDNDVKIQIEKIMQQLKTGGVRGRFTHIENLHLTLVFLGETDRLREAISAAEQVRFDSFTLMLAGLGRFSRSGILWMGVDKCPALWALQHALAEELRRKGFTPEDRPYSPHLTLVREAELPVGAETDSCHSGPLQASVNSFYMMRSDRINGRLCHSVVKQFTVKSK